MRSPGRPCLADATARSAVVVGGGIAGLLAADALVARGLAVTLLEASDRLGGLIQTEHRHSFVMEHGPDAINTANPAGPLLLERLGLTDQVVPVGPGGASILWKGRLHPIPAATVLGIPTSLRAIARSSLFRRGHAVSIALDLLARPGPADVDVSVGHLVRRRLGKAAVDRLVGPLLGGISGSDIDDLSAAAAFPQLLAFEREHGSLIRGARVAAGHRSGHGQFVSFSDGMTQLVESLVARLAGADLVTEEPVGRIDRSASGWAITAPRRHIEADLVVLAVPPRVATGLLRSSVAPAAAEALAGIVMRPAALVHLAYAGVTPGPATGHGFVVADAERRSITGLTVGSAKWPGRAPAGTLLLRAYADGQLAGPDGPSDEHLTRLVAADVRSILELRGDPSFIAVHRIVDAQAIRALGHLDRVAGARHALARAGSIALVGGAYDGPGIPSIFEGVSRELRILLDA